MSASKKSGGSTQCCPCPNTCYSTNSQGSKKYSKKNTNGTHGSSSGNCCDFDYAPDPGDHPGTPGDPPPCFKGENGPNGVILKDKNKIKNDLKDKIKQACPNMSDAEADKKAQDLVEDLENKIKQEADNNSVPDKHYDAAGQLGPCNFTMCLANYTVDPNTGTAEGDGPNDRADVYNNCNPNPPCFNTPPPCPNPGPIPNPPL